MIADGWIMMVGFRIFDVALLVVWLVCFFRLRKDDEPHASDEDDHGGPPLDPVGPSGGGVLGIALPGFWRAGRRERGHARAGGRRAGRRPLRHPGPAPLRPPARRQPPVG